jgi:hypothetical protein
MSIKARTSVFGGVAVLLILGLLSVEHWTVVDSILTGLRDSGPVGAFLVKILLSRVTALVIAITALVLGIEARKEQREHKEAPPPPAPAPAVQSTIAPVISPVFAPVFENKPTNVAESSAMATVVRQPLEEPHLVFGSITYKTLHHVDGCWSAPYDHHKFTRYRAQLLSVRNSPPADNKVIGDAIGLLAEVVIRAGDSDLCHGSPSAWEDEMANKVRIPVGRSKDVILIVCQASQDSKGFWEVVSDNRDHAGSYAPPTITTVPYQFEGTLLVRLIMDGRVFRTARFKWDRNVETGAFNIRQDAQAAS